MSAARAWARPAHANYPVSWDGTTWVRDRFQPRPSRQPGVLEIEATCLLPDGREYCWRCKQPIGDGPRTMGHEPPLAWCIANGIRVSYIRPEHAFCNTFGLASGNLPEWMF